MRRAEGLDVRRIFFTLVPIFFVLMAPAGASGSSAAAAVSPPGIRVTFVSVSSVYLSAGERDGVAVGDRFRVVRDGEKVAELEVTLTSSHKADCRRVSGSGEVRTGDAAFLETENPPASGGTPPARNPGDLGIRGRIGVRYMQIFQQGVGPDYRQPALDLRIDGTRVAGSDFDLHADMRARRTYRTLGDGSSETEGRTRLYRLSVAWQRSDSPWRLSLGRLFSPSLSVESLFDGLLAEAWMGRWGAGLFAGTEPDPVNTSFSSAVRDGGGFFEYGSAAGAARRWAVTTGAVTSRENGEINREFLFLQGRYDDAKLSGAFTQEADLNRGWRREQEGSSWTATSTFATVRWRAMESFSLTGGIDTRRSVRLYRDFVSPETEFDDRYRRGAWIGADGRAGKHFDYGASFRHSDAGGEEDADAATVTLGLRRLGSWGIDLRTRSTRYTNLHLEGWLHSLSAGGNLGSRSHLEIYGGFRDESVLDGWVPEERHDWYGLNFDLFAGRRWLLTATAERNRGASEDNDQIYATVSWRF